MGSPETKNPTSLGGGVGQAVNANLTKENATMNTLSNLTSNVQTMSTREITELTGKRHDNVMQDVRTMLIELHGENALLKFEGGYLDANNQERPCFNLPKRETLILVSGYSVELRARIIDRWTELEAQAAKPVDPMIALSDPIFLRNALLTYSEKVVALEQKVDEMQPDVQAFERIAKSDGLLCLTDTAKTLQMRPKDLIGYMAGSGWIYQRLGSSWIGHQKYINQGLLEHKVTEVLRQDGTPKSTTQVKVTPKGLAKLAKLVGAQSANDCGSKAGVA